MRLTTSLWLKLVCVLIVAAVGAGKATASPFKRVAAQRKARSHTAAHVIGARAASIARRMAGVPYLWGGASPSGFDCSGLVAFAYGKLGVNLPHSSYELYRLGRSVGRWALHPGDLVFFYGAGHVGVYLGRGRFVAATHTGDHVRIASLRNPAYAAVYDGARRIR